MPKADREKLRTLETNTRAVLFRAYPSFVSTWLPGPTGQAVVATVVHRWWQRRQVFALRHQGHFYFPAFQFANGVPKPEVARVLTLLRPTDGWHAMLWFVATNPWLAGKSPVDLIDDDFDAVIEAACYRYG